MCHRKGWHFQGNESQNLFFLIPSGIEYAYEATSFLSTLRYNRTTGGSFGYKICQGSRLGCFGSGLWADAYAFHLSVLLPALYFYSWPARPLYPERPGQWAKRDDDSITS